MRYSRLITITMMWAVVTLAHGQAGEVITVAKDGSGQFTSIEEAVFTAQPGSPDNPCTILVKPGVYEEVVYIQRERRYVRLVGEDPATTIIRFGLHANMKGPDGEKLGTFRTPTVIIDADDFTLENLTIENTAGPVGQALALRVDGDRVLVRNCVLNGWQDTLLVNRGRHLFLDCTIIGSTDFIFGAATAFFENCDIISRTSSYITAAATPEGVAYGLVFRHCRLTGENPDVRTYLGRPWRDFASVVFADCYMSAAIRPEGWHNWSRPYREATVFYAEYNNRGPGAGMASRVPWSRKLSDGEAQLLAPDLVLAGKDGWNPLDGLEISASGRKLWYQQPASVWTEALPVGNGSLGAMVYGDPSGETLQFNQDTLWGGTIHDYSRPGAWKYLDRIRELLMADRQDEAEALAMESFMSVPLRQMKYKAFADLHLEHPGHEEYADYQRELDLSTGVVRVSYVSGGHRYLRETFSSHPDKLIVHRVTSDDGGPVDLNLNFISPHKASRIHRISPTELILVGQVDAPEGIRFAARLRILCEGGTIGGEGETIKVSGASTVTLHLATATSFRNYKDLSADPIASVGKTLQAVIGRSYDSLKWNHARDVQSLFERVSLSLGDNAFTAQPTDQRLENPDKVQDDDLAALLFDYGRYLLIASSRPGSQPANLQGIWNKELEPSWGSKYTLNINAEMNYWPALSTGLEECAEPFYGLIRDVSETGRATAMNHYHMDGWVVHHNTDIWRGSAPINHSNHGIWPTGGAWLCQHLWEHFRYTGDMEFLRQRAYPIMRDSAIFFTQFLMRDPESGWLISGPSNSPENGGLVMGPTMDHQLIRSLFTWTAEAARLLETDPELAARLETLGAEIAPNQIGQHGQLQEWLQDIDDPNNDHRHVSHLWGVYPGEDITWATPDLMKAARQSLLYRGDGGTGWSLAWKLSLWARFLDGNHSHKILQRQLHLVRENPDGSHSGPGGVYPNLFDAHPPFQIDGNFGATAGIVEMLMQSHTGEIVLLPALPDAWESGSVSGLRARGGYTLDFAWDSGKVSTCSITADRAGTTRVRFGKQVETIDLEAGETRNLIN